MTTINDLQERVTKLELIVRARTHRTLGCLCERCTEGEYETAKVVEDLRARLDAVTAERNELRTKLDNEKLCRVYYQDIVYWVCGWLDRLRGGV